MSKREALSDNHGLIYGLLVLPTPLLTMLYMVSYLLFPWPHIFSEEFAYSIFPNLEEEYFYLVGLGEGQFAKSFVNYQINMSALALLLFLINVFAYLGFVSFYCHSDFVISFMRFTKKNFMSLRHWMFAVGLVAISLLYMWGIPFGRTGSPTSRLNLSGQSDFFHLWAFLAASSIFLNFMLPVLVNILMEKLQKLRSRGNYV